MSGILGQASLAAATDTTLFTVASGKVATCNVNLCNRDINPVTVRIALAANSTPTNAEFIEYEAEIAGYGVLERTGLMLEATKKLVVRASAATVSASAYGIEE